MSQQDDVSRPTPADAANPCNQPAPITAAVSPAGSGTLDDRQLHTTSLLEMLTRYRDGDTSALDALLRRIGERLERLARKMLRNYPIVREHEQTEDVLHNALMRLTRALQAVAPSSTAGFFGLAAEQIRRELLDLARYHRRRRGINQPFADAAGPVDLMDPNAPDPRDLDRWQLLHEAVERLPAELREVFSLTFYHGWTQAEMARLLGVSARQVGRLWGRACSRLNEMLGGDLPVS
jgi:RNA polymerase sigma factor (sigma-70 family)